MKPKVLTNDGHPSSKPTLRWARSAWVVEDSEADAEAIVQSAVAVRFGAKMRVFADGYALLRGLVAAEHSASALPNALPVLILLDLNLPGVDGRTILMRLKENALWRKIPVVVLSTSNYPADVQNCYDVGANAYLVKPMELADLEGMLHAIDIIWLQNGPLP